MLTNTSGISNLSGYQAQLVVSNSNRFFNRETPSSESKESNDTVDISSQAKEILTEYQQENSELEQKHEIESQQLEREYLLEKNKLETEFNQKKQRLNINVYV
ncbi:MAG: hypothetical protein A2277_17505 [Desulfobacterales bacterium RIFOXYA12_FULL_46_15]|nr:MAG: hypothetical protein A2097_08920 [Desulfobacula sp. GWF2_41_7]OGR26805.1 MAG: hypothetical protein A2277_17505 [Desulfobacterales bacterium RIFOXYA12_FULL_46_15]